MKGSPLTHMSSGGLLLGWLVRGYDVEDSAAAGSACCEQAALCHRRMNRLVAARE